MKLILLHNSIYKQCIIEVLTCRMFTDLELHSVLCWLIPRIQSPKMGSVIFPIVRAELLILLHLYICIVLAVTVMQSPGYSVCDLICEAMRCPIGLPNAQPITYIGWGTLIKWSLRYLFNETFAGRREREYNSMDMQLITRTSYYLMDRTYKVYILIYVTKYWILYRPQVGLLWNAAQ